jgi:hypothetical protein
MFGQIFVLATPTLLWWSTVSACVSPRTPMMYVGS